MIVDWIYPWQNPKPHLHHSNEEPLPWSRVSSRISDLGGQWVHSSGFRIWQLWLRRSRKKRWVLPTRLSDTHQGCPREIIEVISRVPCLANVQFVQNTTEICQSPCAYLLLGASHCLENRSCFLSLRSAPWTDPHSAGGYPKLMGVIHAVDNCYSW